jgi:hypothetical protein
MIPAILAVTLVAAAGPAAEETAWKPLQSGVDYATIDELHVVRVDPVKAKLRAGLASEAGIGPITAADWSRKLDLAVAINMGMYQTDYRKNVGYLRAGGHRNNEHWNHYRAAVAIHPGVKWVDLEKPIRPPDLDDYEIVVQNLRLIAGPRRNVWSPSDRRWSEAALAIDSAKRLLFLFSRKPYTMHELNDLLLHLPLDITQAMHLEGGPEASLSIHAGGVDLDLCGSYETGFEENDANAKQWPIPNVLGVARGD